VARLREAGDSLAPGLNLLVSFPFPKEASEIVYGDYANTQIVFDINLKNFIPSGIKLPDLSDLPIPNLPLSTKGLKTFTRCLTSGSLRSAACKKVLGSVNLLPRLVKKCKTKQFRNSEVCRTFRLLSDPGGVLPSLPDLELGGLLGLSRLSTALTSGTEDLTGDTDGLFQGATP